MSAKRPLTPDEALALFAGPRSEHDLQCRIVSWCRHEGAALVRDRFAAIPNGAVLAGDASRRARQMGKLKAEGFRAGMPDMVFWNQCWETNEPWVLWLELKHGKNTTSDAQKAVHASLESNGFTVVIARTVKEATAAISDFYQS